MPEDDATYTVTISGPGFSVTAHEECDDADVAWEVWSSLFGHALAMLCTYDDALGPRVVLAGIVEDVLRRTRESPRDKELEVFERAFCDAAVSWRKADHKKAVEDHLRAEAKRKDRGGV